MRHRRVEALVDLIQDQTNLAELCRAQPHLELEPLEIARAAWEVERDDLGLVAGPQDRVISTDRPSPGAPQGDQKAMQKARKQTNQEVHGYVS